LNVKERLLGLLTAFRWHCERATTKETETGMQADIPRRSAAKSVRDLLKLLAVEATEAEINAVAEYQPPGPPKENEPWPGSRVVAYYEETGSSRTARVCYAVRKRPKVERYEVVRGMQQWGHGFRGTLHRIDWKELLDVFDDAATAEQALKDGWPKARKDKWPFGNKSGGDKS
jgi:hypothetical protein